MIVRPQTRWDKVRLFSYLKGGQISSQILSDKVRLFGTSRVVRQLRDKLRLFSTSRVVRQLRKDDGTEWDCLVPQMLSDNSTNSMGKVRLVSTSMVVRQLHKHDVTKWDCLVPQWLSDHKHDGTKWDYLVPQGWSDIITNTIGQSENVWYLKGFQTTSGQSETV